MKKALLFVVLYLLITAVVAQPFKFALVTDTHVGGSTGAEDLERTVNDINSLKYIDFVILSGDVTEFGSEKELKAAKQILSQLQIPCYVLPGNHDSKWSESGNNDFVTIFGAEEFSFEKNGFLFIGTASGPNMRMAPGLVPREQMVFIEKTLRQMKDTAQPVIFINHYPLDNSLANAHEVINLLKTRNIQVSLLGHGHANKLFNFEGIPGVMCRSNLRAKNVNGGYNIVSVTNDSISFTERNPGGIENRPWHRIPVLHHQFKPELTNFANTSNLFPEVKVKWNFQDNSDIGTGITLERKLAVYANTAGEVVAVRKNSGKVAWRFQTAGKIYSTPAIKQNRVVVASTDKNIYCINLKTGESEWKFETPKPIVASPVIEGGTVFIGSSEGIFRAIELITGKEKWRFSSVTGFVETKPIVYNGTVYFGSWGNTFYALDKETGALRWKREKYNNRMLSPAAVWPVAANGKIFIVAPDRRMTALDSDSGVEIWDSGAFSCRESIGISNDGKQVYIKNMTEGHVIAFETAANEQKIAWDCPAELGYEIGPSPITEIDELVFVPTSLGEIVAICKKTNTVKWRIKQGNALVNGVTPAGRQQLLATTLDGWVFALKY
jgi:outer membrane protein assembly factor BamB/predicted MPP superfamily phosphohydrolase